MANYVLCPRCELNYIDEDEQEYCEVCVKEMQGAKLFVDGFEEEEMDEETELCPLCGENYMRLGEKMCEYCKRKSQYEDEEEEDPESDDAWRAYLDEETEDLGIDIPMEDFDEEEEEEEEMEEESIDDDFEYVSADDYNEDDDDEDDEDEDDDFYDDDDAPMTRSKRRRNDF